MPIRADQVPRASLSRPHDHPSQESCMPRDFEDHCWKDVIDPDTLQIYQAYRRKTYVGDNPAVLAIDLYNKAYLGGDRPVKEVDREFSGSCGENAWKAMAPTQDLLAAARRAGVPVIYTTRHVDTAGGETPPHKHSSNRAHTPETT